MYSDTTHMRHSLGHDHLLSILARTAPSRTAVPLLSHSSQSLSLQVFEDLIPAGQKTHFINLQAFPSIALLKSRIQQNLTTIPSESRSQDVAAQSCRSLCFFLFAFFLFAFFFCLSFLFSSFFCKGVYQRVPLPTLAWWQQACHPCLTSCGPSISVRKCSQL